MTYVVEVAAGELVDKITILEIKAEKIGDPEKLANVNAELSKLAVAYRDNIVETEQLSDLKSRLKDVNLTIWRLEDEIRDCERAGRFDDTFITLARAIYKTNDARAALKRAINELLQSSIMEEKSYPSY